MTTSFRLSNNKWQQPKGGFRANFDWLDQSCSHIFNMQGGIVLHSENSCNDYSIKTKTPSLVLFSCCYCCSCYWYYWHYCYCHHLLPNTKAQKNLTIKTIGNNQQIISVNWPFVVDHWSQQQPTALDDYTSLRSTQTKHSHPQHAMSEHSHRCLMHGYTWEALWYSPCQHHSGKVQCLLLQAYLPAAYTTSTSRMQKCLHFLKVRAVKKSSNA